jgi:molecular chaperone GrpE
MESLERETETTSNGEGLPVTNEPEVTEELRQEVARLEDELAEERERHLRLAAEFDNYRRRTRRELREAGQERDRKRKDRNVFPGSCALALLGCL